MGCCVCGAEDYDEGWQRWDDHPARRQWHVVKDLGAGAMAQVVLAQHKESGEMAALKVVWLQSPSVIDDPEHLALLQRESDLLSMLDHPNVVECKDVIRSPKQLVIVLEWLRGGQVIDRLHELGLQYSEQQAAAIFVQAAEAVAHLHEYRVLHRDIKPENVMFAEPPSEAKAAPLTAAQLQAGRPAGGGGKKAGTQKMPVVKLIDLGMACLYDPAKPVTGPLGSPGFVAPEIIAGSPHAPSMDVFSLGVLLFIMLVGRKPFNIKESENLRYAITPLVEAPGLKDPRWLDLSPDAKHLLMAMLAYDPARRITMQQVLEHEWVVSRGGILPRPLGQDVVFGAATVASIRRLRNLCGGVVAFNRAAAATGGKKDGSGKAGLLAGSKSADASRKNFATPSDSAKDAYLRRLKQAQKLDASSRRGNAMHRFATSLASSAYARTHDAGKSINPAEDISTRSGRAFYAPADAAGAGARAGAAGEGSLYRASARMGQALGGLGWRRGSSQRIGGSVRGGTLNGQQGDPSSSRRGRFNALPNGMARAGTTVMLSEMDRASSRSLSRKGSGLPRLSQGATLDPWNAQHSPQQDGSVRGSDAGGLQRRPSTLQMLGAAARAYMDVSTHGSRRGGMAFGPAAAAAAAAAGNGSGSGSPPLARGSMGSAALRQVADDSSVGRRLRLQQQQGQGLAVPMQPPLKPIKSVLEGSGESVSGSGEGGSRHSSAGVPVVDEEGRKRGGLAVRSSIDSMRTPHSGSGSVHTAHPPRTPLPAGGTGGTGAPPTPTVPHAAATVAPPSAACAAGGNASGRRTVDPEVLEALQRACSSPGGGTASGTASGSRSFDVPDRLLHGLRPHVVVKRKSLDNPMLPGFAAAAAAGAGASSPPPGRTWTQMQSVLQQDQMSRSTSSKEGTASATRVVRIKPLQ